MCTKISTNARASKAITAKNKWLVEVEFNAALDTI